MIALTTPKSLSESNSVCRIAHFDINPAAGLLQFTVQFGNVVDSVFAPAALVPMKQVSIDIVEGVRNDDTGTARLTDAQMAAAPQIKGAVATITAILETLLAQDELPGTVVQQ